MKKKSSNKLFSEQFLIKKYFKRLSNNYPGSFNFENDACYLDLSKNFKTIVTTDTIIEGVDFFLNDPPESIAQKILCVNLSDLSAMGALPKVYNLSLTINSKVNKIWIKKFTDKLLKLQKKYKIFLIGGDLSKSKEISLTSTFFGQAKIEYILKQDSCKINDDIWVTGNLGNSYIGYKFLKNLNIRKIDKKNYSSFIKNYLYPKPSMFGYKAAKFINCATDISDGFYGDLGKIIKKNYGAKINVNLIPISRKIRKLLSVQNSSLKINEILSWGDDYELIFTANKNNRSNLLSLSKKNNIKITRVGTITRKKGIFDDSMKLLKNIGSYDHFC